MVGHVTYLSPKAINQIGPQTYHYVKFVEGRVHYTLLSAPYNCIMAIIDQSNIAMPVVVTAYSAL